MLPADRPCVPHDQGPPLVSSGGPVQSAEDFSCYSSTTVKNKKMASKPMVAKIRSTNSVMIAASKTEA
jgi:hypothetical protein